MRHDSNAPDAWRGVEGEDQNTNPQGEEPIMNQNTTSPEHSASDVAEALTLIDASHVHCIDLDPSDALHLDVEPSITKSVEWLGDDIDESTSVHMAYPIDSDGRKTTLPDGWWSDCCANQDREVLRYWRQHANSAIRVGDLLVISLGEYHQVRRSEDDGQPMVEFLNLDGMRRRKDEMRDAWEAEYADAIKAAMPALAATSHVWDYAEFSDVQGVMYEREFGPVTLAWLAEGSNGVVRLADGLQVMVSLGNFSDVLTLPQMRELASALMEAIPVVEAATA